MSAAGFHAAPRAPRSTASSAYVLASSLSEAARRHDVILHGAPRATGWSILSRGEWNGKSVYVKVLAASSDEHLSAELLETWRDGPVVRVLEASGSVQILEAITPGTTLDAQYERLGDGESLSVLGAIASSLKDLGAEHIGYPDTRVRARSLLEGVRPDGIAETVWERARLCYMELADSQHNISVTHGDLHHSNVLWDDSRGWVAIDPKGVVAELEFEMACALRNPISRVTRWGAPAQLRHRVQFVAGDRGLSEERLLRWSFAQSVLAAAWEVEDGLDPTPWVLVAQGYEALI